MSAEPWQKRYKEEFGHWPNRPRSDIDDELNQDNQSDYTYDERFQHLHGRPRTPEEIAEEERLLEAIFGYDNAPMP